MKRSLPLQLAPVLAAALGLAAVGTAPAQPAAQPAAKPRAAAPASAASLKAGARVTLNFVNADVEAVTRAMGAMMERQIVVDPRVKGSITVYSETPMTVREAYVNYLAALRGLGFTVVENSGLLKVVPEADAQLQAGTVSIGDTGRRGDRTTWWRSFGR